MGQGSSAPQASTGEWCFISVQAASRRENRKGADQEVEELSKRLTSLFASRCYSQLELYNYRAVFKGLASKESGVHYWDEATICKFLELPEALQVGAVVFQMTSYLGAFPFPSHAPAILSEGALLKVVTILSERYKKVLKRGKSNWWREIYRSLAVYDKQVISEPEQSDQEPATENTGQDPVDGRGFDIDKAASQDEGQGEDEDELLLAAFEEMNAIDAFRHGEKGNTQHSIIPSDNLLHFIQLLLLIAPMESEEPLNAYGAVLNESRLDGLRATAANILSSFGIEKQPGVSYRNFDAVVSSSLPFMFDGLAPLFEHFLFDKDFDLSKKRQDSQTGPPSPTQTRSSVDLGSSGRRMSSSAGSLPKARKSSFSMGQFGQLYDKGDDQPMTQSPIIEEKVPLAIPPLLPSEGDILDLNILSQLSFFMAGRETLFRRLQPLYSANSAGFSLGSFEKSVFKWQAPTILLVTGTLLPANPTSSRSKAFLESLTSRHLPTSYGPITASGNETAGKRVTYGAYLPVPWKTTPKTSISSEQALLFQLAPHHAVLRASTSNLAKDQAYFCKPPAVFTGVGFGSPVPSSGSSSAATSGGDGMRLARRASWLGDTHYPIGPVSLHLDDALEYAIFTHLTSGGGSYLSSQLPVNSDLPASGNWQDRFEVDALEVWGCGGGKEVEAQREAWKWEEAEAERRRRINLGTGDQEMDRELLKMAGIISDNRSGGSMG